MPGSDDMDLILSSISHVLRRRIIALLAASGELSYNEMLRQLGVESSLLSFHLKKLKGLVEKTSSGIYKLTPLGYRAAGMLRCIEGAGREEGLQAEGLAVYFIGEQVLLEAYKKGGLTVSDTLIVVIDRDVSRSLIAKTLKGIRRALVVYAPVGLVETVESRLVHVKALVPYTGRPPQALANPASIVRDLEARGYHKIAGELARRLGLVEGPAEPGMS